MHDREAVLISQNRKCACHSAKIAFTYFRKSFPPTNIKIVHNLMEPNLPLPRDTISNLPFVLIWRYIWGVRLFDFLRRSVPIPFIFAGQHRSRYPGRSQIERGRKTYRCIFLCYCSPLAFSFLFTSKRIPHGWLPFRWWTCIVLSVVTVYFDIRVEIEVITARIYYVGKGVFERYFV